MFSFFLCTSFRRLSIFLFFLFFFLILHLVILEKEKKRGRKKKRSSASLIRKLKKKIDLSLLACGRGQYFRDELRGRIIITTILLVSFIISLVYEIGNSSLFPIVL